MNGSARRTLGPGTDDSDREAPQHNGTDSVRFVASDQPLISLLEVCAPAEWDVIVDVYRTLHHVRVQVVHAAARHAPHAGAVQYRLYVVELDGAMLDRQRRDEVVAAVGAMLKSMEMRDVPLRSVARTRAPRSDDGPSAKTTAEDSIEEVA